jgi:hypothetical protein
MPGLDDYSVQETRNIAILAKAQPIRSTLVTTDGQQQRKFIFPDCGIGSLTQCDYSKPYNLGFGQHKFEKAKGTVWVTANVPLMLELQFTDYPGTLETLSIVDKIDPEEFCGLALTGGPVMPEESPTKNMAQMLKTASRWTNINSVELHNLAEDKEVFAALETMKGLRNLVLAMPDLSSVDLGQSPFLGRLETLMLSDFGNSDVADLIPGLAGSLNLKQLSLNNTPVSAASILELSKCPNLNYLEIGGQPIDDELVQAIAQLHSLRVVVFKESLTREQILMLTRCPWLRGIKLAKESYTRPIQKSLERLDARIEFFSRLPQSADKERLPSAKRGL